MHLVWDEEEWEYIERWMFTEWFLNTDNMCSNQTLNQLKQLAYKE